MLETTPLRLWISSKSNRVQVRVFVVSATKMHRRTFVAVTVRRNKISRKILTFKMTNVSNPFLRFFSFLVLHFYTFYCAFMQITLRTSTSLTDGNDDDFDDCLFTWMQLGRLVRCSERATLTQPPHTSYCGLRAPTTPAVTAPALIPAQQQTSHHS